MILRLPQSLHSWQRAVTEAEAGRPRHIHGHAVSSAAAHEHSMTPNSEPAQRIAVVAFGGNALLRRGEELTIDAERRNAEAAAAAVARLVTGDGLRVCITHGNGPQVGLLAQADPDSGLDVLDAETEGQIGYILESSISNSLNAGRGGGAAGTEVVSLLTQIAVDPDDPAFQHPTKPIGRWYSQEDAQHFAAEKGWVVAQDGDKWRRVVASPAPQSILELGAIRTLLEAGVVVICCGGGGIPVAVDAAARRRRGVEAVIDKDAASALLANDLGASWLIMLTDQKCVYDPEKWAAGEKVPLPSPITVSEVGRLSFASGSMAPKMAAACEFVRGHGGRRAAVGAIDDLLEIVRGGAGTAVVAD